MHAEVVRTLSIGRNLGGNWSRDRHLLTSIRPIVNSVAVLHNAHELKTPYIGSETEVHANRIQLLFLY